MENKLYIQLTTFNNIIAKYDSESNKDINNVNLFTDFEGLENFLKNNFYDSTVELCCIGGEPTTRPESVVKIFNVCKNINKDKNYNMKLIPSVITNGSNTLTFPDYIERGLILPSNLTILWDGCESFDKVRKGTKVKYSNLFFNRNLVILGKNWYGKMVKYKYCVIDENVKDFFKDFEFLVETGAGIFEYYFSDKRELSKSSQEIFLNQLEQILNYYNFKLRKNQFKFINLDNYRDRKKELLKTKDIYIDYRGKLFTSLMDMHLNIRNIGSLKSGINSSRENMYVGKLEEPTMTSFYNKINTLFNKYV